MKRKYKLQFIGTSWMIALPPDWIRHWNLKKGDLLEVEPDEERPTVDISVRTIQETRDGMFLRSIQNISDTYYIWIPSAWVAKHKLKKSQPLTITYNDEATVTVSV